ncbi:MAG: DUF4082 domain-containing protein [Nitrospiraceae bacterium]|nr:MAG: DUF4082 domain-containing protein [Nitrospiraceae bacterium]
MEGYQSYLLVNQNKVKAAILQMVFYLLIFQSGYAQMPGDGQVAYWSFNEWSGSTAQDSAGYNTGSLINGPSWVTGRAGNALSFDGINDYVEIPDHPSLDLTAGEFTLSVWIYPESYGEALNGRIIDHCGASEGEGGWSLLVNNYQGNQNLRLTIKNGSSIQSVYSDIGSIGLSAWQHVAVTLEFGTVTFYVDGQIEGQAGGIQSPSDQNCPVRIGMRADDMFRAYTGVIDEVRIYNRALSYQEIIDLYDQFPPLSDMNPPVISDGQPAGELPLETTVVTLSVTTDEAATCKYSTTPDTPYSSMYSIFSDTGGTTHTNQVSGMEYLQSQTYYVKCRDLSGNSGTVDYPVSFSFNRTVYSVSPNGSDANPGTDTLPLKTIQRAIDYASTTSDSALIKVAQGVYQENISIACCPSRNNLRLLGGWNSDFTVRVNDPSLTVIDGGGWQRVIRVNVHELDFTLEGFTIRNGVDSAAGGGIAVFPFYRGAVTINLVNNTIMHNTSGSAGGGVYVFSKENALTTLNLTDNIIAHNSADDICGGVCVISEDHADTTVTLSGNTVIDNSAGNEGGGIYIRSYTGASTTSTFIKNVITGNSTNNFGAGLFIYSETDAVLTADFLHNRITGNAALYMGGGIYLHSVSNSTLTTNFEHNTISGNTAGIHGGGIYELSGAGASLLSSYANNSIEENRAAYDGGGVFSWGANTLSFINSMISDNMANRGGGLFVTEGSALTLINNTITGNNALFHGGGIYALHCSSSAICCIPDDPANCRDEINGLSGVTTIDVQNTIVSGNTAVHDGHGIYIKSAYEQGPGFTEVNVSYSNIDNYVYDTSYPGIYNDQGNNISSSPFFRNKAGRDYHLSSSSPLINKGNNSAVAGTDTDFEGGQRIMYGTVDIGADEHVYSLLKSDTVPDIDGDLSEFTGTDSIIFSSTEGDNSVTVQALWNNEALYLAQRVTDSKLNASTGARDRNLKNEDSAGMVIDTLNNDGGSGDPAAPYMLEDDYMFLVNIMNTQYDSQGTPSGIPNSSWNSDWESAVQFTGTINDNSDMDNGYTVEMKIPWANIYPSVPSENTSVRIGLLVYDKDDSSCYVDPAGTYIDAEYYTDTLNEQGDFSVQTIQGGHLNSGYLKSLSPGSQNIFTDQVPLNAYLPATPFEIGVKWTSDVDGYITGVRFFKHSSNTNTHKGRLWQGTTLLANKTFVLEDPQASGWQTVYFDDPVFISAGVTYMVTMNRVGGYYYQNNNYFGAVDNAPLHISAGQSGVYKPGPASYFECTPPCTPQLQPDTVINSNYWVDVVFARSVPSCSDISGRENKKYELEFPAGTYTVWLRGYARAGADTVLVGVDDSCIGTYKFTAKDQWSWTHTAIEGTNLTGALSSGTHHIDIWSRQADVLIDGIYLTTGNEYPTDISHGIELVPYDCSTSSRAIWPEVAAINASENASNWHEVLISVPTPYYCDYDHDGYTASLPSGVCIGSNCHPLYCQIESGTDCDDNDFYEHPYQVWYKDFDNDDYSDGTSDQTSCVRPPGHKTGLELLSVSDDCDDTNKFVYPWAPEIWYDGIDQDCDGWNDYDQDMDRYVNDNWNSQAGGTSTGINDCNDTDPSISPETRWCPDDDGDGYGDPAFCIVQCYQPHGYVTNNLDCDDNDAYIYPGGPPVRIFGGILSYYYLIREAYAAAGAGETIQCRDLVHMEDLTFDLEKTVHITGGYDCTYTGNTGITRLNGTLYMIDGTVTIERFILQPSSN